jgi:hypothetical protein
MVFLGSLLVSGCKEDPPSPPPGCMSHAECADGELCADGGICVPGAECTNDAECTDPRQFCNLEGFTCDFREGFADECDERRPCPFGQFCSPLRGMCFDAATARDCTRRSQCPAGQICDASANKCVEDIGCYGDQFCEEEEICDLVTRVCRSITIDCIPCEGTAMSCPSGTLCNPDTVECLDGGADPACRIGEFCDILGRCVQCTNDDHCGPGTYCNVAQGKCDSDVQCAPDPSQCPESPNIKCVICTPPQTCNLRTRRCEAPAVECESDVDCPGDQFCNMSLDPPICQPRIPDCLNDLREGLLNNDSPGAATELPKMEGPLFDEIRLCPADEDWYEIDVDAGTYLTVDARFSSNDGDIELQLYLDDGQTLLDESRSITDNERVEVEIGTRRHLLVRVFLQLPVLQPVDYQLIVSHDPGRVCADDANEPNDVIGGATNIMSDMPFEARLCTADPDWYALRQIPAGQKITASLAFTDALGDLDMELYRAGSTTPLVRSVTVDDNENIEYDASFAGDYFLRVFAKAADTNVYTLRSNVRDNPNATCADDAFEANNNAGEATRAPNQTGEYAPGLSICAGDQDWYVVNLGPSEGLAAEIGFEPNADLELKLYAPGSTSATTAPVRASTGISTREFIAWRSPQSGDYLLQVKGLNDRQISPYELRITRTPPFICAPDAIDMQMLGDTLQNAYQLNPAPTRLDNLTLCAADQDWYDLPLPAGFMYRIRIHYSDVDATLDMEVTDNSGFPLAVTQGAGVDFKEIIGTIPGSGIGQLFLHILNSGGLEAPYSIVVDAQPIAQCFNDFLESNDAVNQATQVITATVPESRSWQNLTLCSQTPNFFTGQGDEDWFALYPPAEGVRMEASLTHDSGDLFLELRSPGGFVRACRNISPNRCYSDGSGLSESVVFTSTVGEPYFIRVGSVYGHPSVPIRPLGADTAYDLEVRYTLVNEP